MIGVIEYHEPFSLSKYRINNISYFSQTNLRTLEWIGSDFKITFNMQLKKKL